MKVSINYEVVNRIWGGGNKFVISLIDQLKKNNHDVIHHLNDNDIDIILIIDPRKYLENIKYGAGAVQRYICQKIKRNNPKVYCYIWSINKVISDILS